MNDRFKFRYVFEKDFGGKTGICYKMPVFNLDDAVRSVFENKIIEYTNFGYKLVAKKQCTGLKDKNGKLIYEGDIVYDGKNKRIVLWEDDCFRYPALKTDRYFHKPISNFLDNRKTELRNKLTFTCNVFKKDKKNFEVIGNIYENKELLQ